MQNWTPTSTIPVGLRVLACLVLWHLLLKGTSCQFSLAFHLLQYIYVYIDLTMLLGEAGPLTRHTGTAVIVLQMIRCHTYGRSQLCHGAPWTDFQSSIDYSSLHRRGYEPTSHQTPLFDLWKKSPSRDSSWFQHRSLALFDRCSTPARSTAVE